MNLGALASRRRVASGERSASGLALHIQNWSALAKLSAWLRRMPRHSRTWSIASESRSVLECGGWRGTGLTPLSGGRNRSRSPHATKRCVPPPLTHRSPRRWRDEPRVEKSSRKAVETTDFTDNTDRERFALSSSFTSGSRKLRPLDKNPVHPCHPRNPWFY